MEFVILYLLVNIAVGAIACFMGKKLFYVMLGALVFLGVFNIGMSTSDGSPVSLIVALVLGVVAALLSKYAYKAGVFLIGCAAGAALGFIVSLFLPQEYAGYSMVVLALAAILLGLAALKWCDFFVRVGTAYTGATFVVPNVLAAVLAFGELTALAVPADSLATFNALSDYIANDFASLYGTPIFLGTLILTIVGSIVQQRQ
ncbi:DUF4203 domain-containing protein [Collinsella tanakaei]|uniref:DUF4203 domain-containing protein n=1 Tax=Collinsella tanakaei TaxID=626935 RepID=UPI0025A49552|nr:DUF4203 domain-containing protein [Collinsella tanakaei]MDM8246413.1 DUF4203 domain-containing protein [Collinsella tanakaei]